MGAEPGVVRVTRSVSLFRPRVLAIDTLALGFLLIWLLWIDGRLDGPVAGSIAAALGAIWRAITPLPGLAKLALFGGLYFAAIRKLVPHLHRDIRGTDPVLAWGESELLVSSGSTDPRLVGLTPEVAFHLGRLPIGGAEMRLLTVRTPGESLELIAYAPEGLGPDVEPDGTIAPAPGLPEGDPLFVPVDRMRMLVRTLRASRAVERSTAAGNTPGVDDADAGPTATAQALPDDHLENVALVPFLVLSVISPILFRWGHPLADSGLATRGLVEAILLLVGIGFTLALHRDVLRREAAAFRKGGKPSRP